MIMVKQHKLPVTSSNQLFINIFIKVFMAFFTIHYNFSKCSENNTIVHHCAYNITCVHSNKLTGMVI